MKDLPFSRPKGSTTLGIVAACAAILAAGCGGQSSAQKATDPSQNAVRIVATRSSKPEGALQRFHTYKDLRPTRIKVNMNAAGTTPGYIFLTPRTPDPSKPSGPTILDSQGRIVWFHPIANRVTSDLSVHTYKGKQILSWGERPPVKSPADLYKVQGNQAFHVLVDQNYREIAKVRMQGKGVGTDMHELVVTKRNTVLMLGFRVVKKDLSSLGGPAKGRVVDAIVQEIDPETNKVLFNWSALENIPLSESGWPVDYDDPWDPYHINSVTVDRDGNLLVSMRHTSAIYKLDRKTGKIIWRLGGKNSDFEVTPRARFYFQHDPQPLPNNRLMIFDNRNAWTIRRGKYSRVIILKLDMKRKRASLQQEIVHEKSIVAVSQGNARVTKNGNIFVGWGNRQWFSEYTPQGQQLFDAEVPAAAYQSYRALKGDWVGRPKIAPAVVASHVRGRTMVWVSMNGATEVRRWRVLGGPTERALEPLGVGDWRDFETRLDVAASPAVIQVQAIDKNGEVIASSGFVRPKN